VLNRYLGVAVLLALQMPPVQTPPPPAGGTCGLGTLEPECQTRSDRYRGLLPGARSREDPAPKDCEPWDLLCQLTGGKCRWEWGGFCEVWIPDLPRPPRRDPRRPCGDVPCPSPTPVPPIEIPTPYPDNPEWRPCTEDQQRLEFERCRDDYNAAGVTDCRQNLSTHEVTSSCICRPPLEKDPSTGICVDRSTIACLARRCRD